MTSDGRATDRAPARVEPKEPGDVLVCPCGIAAEQPWRTRDAVFSPASIVGGLVVLAFGVLALVAGLQPWVGWLVFGVVGVLIIGAAVLEAGRGHRGWCLARRAVWFGVALPGAPLRVLASIP